MLLEEATVALGRLDAAQLEAFAVRLQAILADGERVTTTAEVQARQRVFASVVRATGRNLAVLERAGREGTEWGR